MLNRLQNFSFQRKNNVCDNHLFLGVYQLICAKMVELTKHVNSLENTISLTSLFQGLMVSMLMS